ncbi:uncharacterized protein LOC127737594 [Mytilus californianus]|uniref:uncharacterized protein LOC127737594 n=1 Tax=Mytilus californianus TaxID=6549 RepID=UPI0022463B59|nr:uncharacterized protein LOC127737594 [Mytilus californianus]
MAAGVKEKNWSNVSPSEISAARWPFRFCDIKQVESCEEVLEQGIWEQIVSHSGTRDCTETWNSTQIKQCRNRFKSFGRNCASSLGRNLLHCLLMKHFDGRFIAQQKVPLKPFEIYTAPCRYAKYKPLVDICLDDPSYDASIYLNIIEVGSKPDLEDSIHQTMFSTLSGGRSTSHCCIIKVAPRGIFQVYVGKIDWPVEMHQMMMICGSNVTKELGFNHQSHSKPIIAKYAHLGDISLSEDDCPVVSLLLKTVEILSESERSSFLPITGDMMEVIETRKRTIKHISSCVFDDLNLCNAKFDQCSSREDKPNG